MRQIIKKFFDDESGTTAIEYCIIAGGLSIVIVTVVNGIGTALSTKFADVSTSLKQRQIGRGVMQELLFGPLLLTWGPKIIDYVRQYPWRIFAAVLVFVLLMDLMFRKRSRGSGDGGDFSGLDFGGDGDCGGD